MSFSVKDKVHIKITLAHIKVILAHFVRSSAPFKPISHNIGSVCLHNGSKEFEKLGQKGAFLVHSAISKPNLMDLVQ